MAKEIERKFLVLNTSYRELADRTIDMAQAYLSVNARATVRVRITDSEAFLTVKSKTHGIERDEWEYQIPREDALGMLRCCSSGIVEKKRYKVPYGGYVWEVDEFGGAHQGLVVAEIELPSADAAFEIPPFIGQEVTGDPRYYNSYLAAHA